MEELVGKKILGIFPDSSSIVFATSDGGLSYTVEGDCCSHSWFESIQGVEALMHGTVSRVEPLALGGDEDAGDSYSVVKVYGIRIVTDKGYATIEYRNSSNGYYGGWCRFDGTCAIPEAGSIQDDWSS